MRKWLIMSASSVLGAVLMSGGGGTAFAAVHDDGNIAGGMSKVDTIPIESASETQRAIAKVQLASALFAANTGSGSRVAAIAAVGEYQEKYGNDAVTEAATALNAKDVSVASLKDVPANTLDVAQQAQTKNFYCGPAAAVALLEYVHPSKSHYNQAKLSQAALAKAAYLKTDASHSTSWASGRMKIALARWTGQSFYLNTASPEPAEFQELVYVDVMADHPLVADAVEYKNKIHYNHHPTNKIIGHWLTARGYTKMVADVKFTDSAHSAAVSWGLDRKGADGSVVKGPERYFTYNTTDFAKIFLKANGIVW